MSIARSEVEFTDPLVMPCSRPQCQNPANINSLHCGYVAHRAAGEPACPASLDGHRQYVQNQRLAKAAFKKATNQP